MNRKTQPLCLLFSLLLILSAGCSRHVTKIQSQESKVIFPAPPDTARIQFLTSISTSVQVTGKRSKFGEFILGETPSKDITKPYGIAISGTRIYICDSGLGGLEIIDLEKEEFEYFTPSGKGQLQLPLNCCVDDAGNLYIADGERKQIVVFDSLGNFSDAFGDPDNFKPTDVGIWGQWIYVTNVAHNQVVVFSKDSHQKIFSFPDAESGQDPYLYSPANLFIDKDGVYVSDFGGSQVKKYSHNGEYISSIGSYGKSIGQFARLKGIAVDRNSTLYAVDAGFENVQMFDREGKLLMFFGGPYKGPGYMWLPAKVAISYENLEYFQKYVDPDYELEYLVFVTNQYGPDKVGIYGFVHPKYKAEK
jgi:DNA-binding beta-propeller fold protein YncE